MKRILQLAALGALLASPVLAETAPGWQRYTHPESGLTVDIPVGIFDRDAGPAENGPGRKFVTSDGRANLTVQTLRNARGDSPAAFLAAKGPPPGIVYRRVARNFFVVSSFRDDMIWYNRCNFVRGAANCVLINYPAREKARWDGVVTRISRSLKG
jgi:hypothetical protein